jgi:hypothetical protein
MRQFDFWIGEWDLYSRSRVAPNKDEWQEGRASNSVRAVLDGCVILENFDGHPAVPLRGMSVSTYNARLGKWQQTWVDSGGSYLDFTGEFKDGRMELSREAQANGGKVRQRMVFYNITKDRFDWNWEASRDEGKTWVLLWKITYARKK